MNPELAAAFPEDAAQIDGLIRKITAAFEGVPRPMITRSVAEAIDDLWGRFSDEEGDRLNASDPEQVWTDVTDDQVEDSRGYFTWAGDEGWLFYLPAHMCYMLRALPRQGSSDVYQYCIDRKPCFGLFNEVQLECVREFMDLLRKYDCHY